MLEYFVLAFLAGFMVKMTDEMEDTVKTKTVYRYLFAVVYGALIGYIISQASFSMIFLGALIAQVLMRKIDNISHIIGTLTAVAVLLLFGLPELAVLPLAYFAVFASIDELDSLIFWSKPKWVAEFRPFLELAAVPFALMGQWQFLAGILSFDIGYLVFKSLVNLEMLEK
ncbi:hypothetical protein JXB01_02995 [Candidatus Micrarchaeota archaeon]|nr:hypothetical protein [Candidatus Micrarchaeota archaeon]